MAESPAKCHPYLTGRTALAGVYNAELWLYPMRSGGYLNGQLVACRTAWAYINAPTNCARYTAARVERGNRIGVHRCGGVVIGLVGNRIADFGVKFMPVQVGRVNAKARLKRNLIASDEGCITSVQDGLQGLA